MPAVFSVRAVTVPNVEAAWSSVIEASRVGNDVRITVRAAYPQGLLAVQSGSAGILARLLPDAGFAPRVEVANFVKESRDIPDYGWAGAEVRPAALDDLPALLANDRAAFDPIWWHTLDSLQRALRDMAHFVVAEVDGRSVGHAFSDLYGRQGHLVRLAVHPNAQGRGIGTRLLAESLEHLIAKCSAWPLTLNTQTDNYTSQSLYRRFGFAPTGDSTMVMVCET